MLHRPSLERSPDQFGALVPDVLQNLAEHLDRDREFALLPTFFDHGDGAIGNMAKIAFNKAKVAGSGHRLRAHAIENELVRQLRLAQVRGGRNHMMNDAILNTAQFAGHLSTLSLRDYANQIRRRQNEVEQQVVGVEDVDLADQLRAISAKGGDKNVQRAVSWLLKLLGLEPLPQRGSRDDVRNLAAIAGAPRGPIHQEPLR